MSTCNQFYCHNSKDLSLFLSEPVRPASTESVHVDSPPEDVGYKDLTDSALKSLMRSFRLTDLQTLMIFAGKNKAGRKTELLVSVIYLYYGIPY